MPPDRGAAKRTSNVREAKKETKVTTGRKDAKEVEVSRRVRGAVKDNPKGDGTSTRKEVGKDSKNSAQKAAANDRIGTRKRVDVETVNNTKDLPKDLNKGKDSLIKRNVSKSSSLQTPSKIRPNGSVYDRLASKTNPVTTKRAPSIQRSSSTQQYQSSGKSLSSGSKRTSDSTLKSKIEKSSHERSKNSKLPENKTSQKDEKKPQKMGHERSKTRTLSPHEIKFARSFAEVPQVEPSTITRRKEPSPEKSIEGENAGTSQSKGTPIEDNYEDDFEDYESDFEEDIPESSDASSSASDALSVSASSLDESDAQECEIVVMTSRPVVEEEKKLDSGNYDLTENGKRKTGKELQQIKAALEKENVSCLSEKSLRSRGKLQRQSTLPQDEGFEEERVEHTGFINFESARQHVQRRKESAQAQQKGQRGRELLSMIALDSVAFSLLDIPPVPYDVYMKTYGRTNSVQAHVQTNEDNLSEEVQCDEIVMKNKWTQHPVSFHTNKDNPEVALLTFSQDRLGCGGDSKEDRAAMRERERQLKYDSRRLNEFLLQRGKFILQLLEQNSGELEKFSQLTKSTAVTSGYISFGVDSISFIKGRPVSHVCFTHHPPTRVATVHNQLKNNSANKCPNTIVERSMLCVWSVTQPSSPQKILVSSEDITACCFDADSGDFVFAGLCDGAVCVWDLKESTAAHRALNSVVDEWVLCSPTYSSAEILKSEGHLNRVVAVQALPPAAASSGSSGSSGSGDLLAPQQMCSLDSGGLVIVWTVIPHATWTGCQEDLGLAHWGHVRLVRSIRINTADSLPAGNRLLSALECHDLQVDLQDPNHLYVCSNTGHVIHCLINGGKPQPRVYSSSKDECSPATCISSCQFDQPNFLVGYEGGSVKLYVRGSSRPLASYTGDGMAVRSLQWSAVRPTVFYALDTQSRIHVWDLSVSDIHPVETIVFGGEILSIKLSQKSTEKKQYLAVTTAEGTVHLHQLRAEYSQSSSTIFDAQLKLFLLYTSCL